MFAEVKIKFSKWLSARRAGNKNSQDPIDTCKGKVRLVAAKAIRPSEINDLSKESQHAMYITVCQ